MVKYSIERKIINYFLSSKKFSFTRLYLHTNGEYIYIQEAKGNIISSSHLADKIILKCKME